MKVCIFIPAWNVQEEISGVLQRLPTEFARNCAEIFVQDNASTDGTADEAIRAAASLPFPVSVYRNSRNLGYGGSQIAAYTHAIRHGYDAVVMLHGDGQYPSEQVPALVRELEDGHTGMIYGTRMLRSEEQDQTPLIRRVGVRSLSWLQNMTSGMNQLEWYSGYRAFRCDALQRVPFQSCDTDYYFDVQIILLMGLAGIPVRAIPVAKKYDGRPSPVNIYQFGWKVLRRLMSYPMARMGLVRSKLYRQKFWSQLKQASSQPELTPYAAA